MAETVRNTLISLCFTLQITVDIGLSRTANKPGWFPHEFIVSVCRGLSKQALVGPIKVFESAAIITVTVAQTSITEPEEQVFEPNCSYR